MFFEDGLGRYKNTNNKYKANFTPLNKYFVMMHLYLSRAHKGTIKSL